MNEISHQTRLYTSKYCEYTSDNENEIKYFDDALEKELKKAELRARMTTLVDSFDIISKYCSCGYEPITKYIREQKMQAQSELDKMEG